MENTHIINNDSIAQVLTKEELDMLDLFVSLVSDGETMPLVLKENELKDIISVLDESKTEYCWSHNFDPELISSACYQGFLPMAAELGGYYILLLKLHNKRCILDFENLHIPRTAKKRSRKFDITIDQAFEQCIEQISHYHDDSWLYPPLVETLKLMFYSKQYKTKLHSFEVWDNNELVAGEIGYVVGSCYTSMTGFCNRNSAGTIQLWTTGKLLKHKGFAFWDLGMKLKYKLDLGASCIPRNVFLSKLFLAQNNTPELSCEKSNGYTILALK